METEIPPQVETEVSHTSFPIWRIRRPYDGVSVPYTTNFHHASCKGGLGYFYIFSCAYMIRRNAVSVYILSQSGCFAKSQRDHVIDP